MAFKIWVWGWMVNKLMDIIHEVDKEKYETLQFVLKPWCKKTRYLIFKPMVLFREDPHFYKMKNFAK